jgi:DsbC/DsbD-like thiol-disulfide interchange protein
MKSVRILAVVCCAMLGVVALAAAPSATVKFTLADKSATPGSTVKGTVKITIPAGEHAYQNPASKDYMIPLTVKSSTKDVKLVSAAYPKGVPRQTVGETDEVMVYEGTVEVPVVLRLSAKTGTVTIKLTVGYQLCTEHNCDAPEEVVVTAKIDVKPAKP